MGNEPPGGWERFALSAGAARSGSDAELRTAATTTLIQTIPASAPKLGILGRLCRSVNHPWQNQIKPRYRVNRREFRNTFNANS